MAAQSTGTLNAYPPKNSGAADSQDKGLDALFAPKSIALIGATDREGSVGQALAKNLSTFTGTLFFINANKPTVCGRTAYPNLASIGESARVDLAVIATPAATKM